MNQYLLTFMVQSYSKGKTCMQKVWACNNEEAAHHAMGILRMKWAGFEPVSIICL